MKTKLFFLLLVSISLMAPSQTTSVPDDNFEEYLETHDANGNVVTLGHASSMGDGIIDNDMVPTSKINTVTELRINGWSIYDLTGIEDFTALQIFDCNLNPISTMKLPGGNNLVELYCHNLDLTSLDVSSHTALTTLNCRFNDITSLSLSANTNLINLDCWGNPLGSLTLTNLTELKILNCQDTMLGTLDLSTNTKLEILSCGFNDLTGLNLTNNTALTNVFCYANSTMTSLNLPDTNTLVKLECYGCNLGSLDISKNTGLTYLTCQQNALTNLDASNNTSLGYLDCGENILTSLTLPDTATLYRLICDNNDLPTLNISKNMGLTGLFCYSNQIASLDCSNNPLIERIWCSDNDLTSINLPNNPALWELYCANNAITPTIDVSSCTGLVDFGLWNNNLTDLDLTNNMVLEYVEPGNNPNLTNLTLPNTTTLTQLWAYGTNLSNLDYTKNTGLQYLDLGITKFTSIDASMLPNLVEFWGNLNPQLTSLNLKNNHNDILNYVRVEDNPNLTCIQVDNVAQAEAKADWTKDDWASYNTSCSLGIEDNDKVVLLVFPNPTTNIININIKAQAVYTITTLLGEKVAKGHLTASENKIDITNLTNGIYFLTVSGPMGRLLTKKVLKK
ncbi:T9SS type A sorting domain-containing protein [Snuella sedimenti]|uniref:T9SS type A sorting domain-containing protein n=1 Tax=Snuella sedimenti TaxID=2798802 RepID=A0A8J7IGU7_9FLAO|nr:T9SS type A sorting domain-containing protein [Snuella sedimenti]MBJ6367216.1 T9SS type A sorting domain-containing protein [Snuella sedimenti]